MKSVVTQSVLIIALTLHTFQAGAEALTYTETICVNGQQKYIVSYLYTDSNVSAYYNLYKNFFSSPTFVTYVGGSWTGNTSQSVNQFCPGTLRDGGLFLHYRYLGTSDSAGYNGGTNGYPHDPSWADPALAPGGPCGGFEL